MARLPVYVGSVKRFRLKAVRGERGKCGHSEAG
jgi:hypothetical protein